VDPDNLYGLFNLEKLKIEKKATRWNFGKRERKQKS